MRTNDNGTSADKRAIQRNREPARPWEASGRACRTTPGDVTRHALSYVWNLAPIIHPLPQPPPAAIVYQRASVEVTLSFREKLSPLPKASENTKSCRDCGAASLFSQCRRSADPAKGRKIPNCVQRLNHC